MSAIALYFKIYFIAQKKTVNSVGLNVDLVVFSVPEIYDWMRQLKTLSTAPLIIILTVNLIFMFTPILLFITASEIWYATGHFLSATWPFIIVGIALYLIHAVYERKKGKPSR